MYISVVNFEKIQLMSTISSQTCASQITRDKRTKAEKNAQISDPLKKGGLFSNDYYNKKRILV